MCGNNRICTVRYLPVLPSQNMRISDLQKLTTYDSFSSIPAFHAIPSSIQSYRHMATPRRACHTGRTAPRRSPTCHFKYSLRLAFPATRRVLGLLTTCFDE